MGLRNAHVDANTFVMRVGIPHRGGTLAAHAFDSGYPVMVSASAYWDAARARFIVPQASSLEDCDLALDSAGFTAVLNWKRKGAQPGMAGVFPWSCAAYLELAQLLQPSWYSQADLCCEKELATSPQEVDHRIRVTATLLEGMLRQLYAWCNELVKELPQRVVENMIRPPVPVLQGWTAADYRRSLDLLNEVWARWQPWLDPPRLIGIGSVCRRDTFHPEHGLLAIVDSLQENLPAGSALHLFGVKGEAVEHLRHRRDIASADSMAYDLAARIKAHGQGVSNTMPRRCAEMTRWMSSAMRQCAAHT